MNDIILHESPCDDQRLLERVRYFPRQLLDAPDMVTDQDYFREKMRRHNRYLHGWGVVCGLEVKADPDPAGQVPWRVRVEEGYALGPYGDEIYVAEPVLLDLAHCGPDAVKDPCEPGLLYSAANLASSAVYLAIKYVECVARPVRAMPVSCACDEEVCEYSRIRDSYQFGCLAAPSLSQRAKSTFSLADFCNRTMWPPCPECPTDPWVVLAKIDFREGQTGNDALAIDSSVRRQILSTQTLQRLLRDCCCKGEPAAVTFRVKNVRILENDNAGELFAWNKQNLDPTGISIPYSENANTIQVEFTEPANRNTIGLNTFVVYEHPELALNGSIEVLQSNCIVNWVGDSNFVAGKRYRVKLFGEKNDCIASVQNFCLDGEVTETLPSGDDQSGGDFEFTFVMQQN